MACAYTLHLDVLGVSLHPYCQSAYGRKDYFVCFVSFSLSIYLSESNHHTIKCHSTVMCSISSHPRSGHLSLLMPRNLVIGWIRSFASLCSKATIITDNLAFVLTGGRACLYPFVTGGMVLTGPPICEFLRFHVGFGTTLLCLWERELSGVRLPTSCPTVVQSLREVSVFPFL